MEQSKSKKPANRGGVKSNENKYQGIFLGSPKGFGFVSREDAPGRDVFIPVSRKNGAMHKDTVLFRVLDSADGRQEGEVLRVLSRGYDKLVGTYEIKGKNGFVIPDEKRIPEPVFIAEADSKKAVSGHKVVVKLSGFKSGTIGPEGSVITILGHKNDPGVDVLSIVSEMDIPHIFPKPALAAADKAPPEVSKNEKMGRLDLRHLQTITIDGADTKDVDDAITLETLPNGRFKLGVHIADVAHYVKDGGALDTEARKRGTSVYLADRVIPMLPHPLSNGICSLNPGVDRLALSCLMDVDEAGNVTYHDIAETVIRVDAPISYESVLALLTKEDPVLREKYAAYLPMLEALNQLRAILAEKRDKRGAIEFEFPETKILCGPDGAPIDILPRSRDIATEIIEECMILCNETVASHFFWLDAPFIYRCHEEPDGERLRALAEISAYLGFRLRGNGTHPGAIKGLLKRIKGTPQEAVLSRAALRSLRQARYMPENLGHFGLASKCYCHFTSPIRRYPDLFIHRIIKAKLHGSGESFMAALPEELPGICTQCSFTERRAESCEREAAAMKKAEFMTKFIGETFTGVVSGMTNWGIYVMLPNTVEGMVSPASIQDDYYIFDKDRMRYEGERTGRRIALGDSVSVVVTGASPEDRTVDFSFI